MEQPAELWEKCIPLMTITAVVLALAHVLTYDEVQKGIETRPWLAVVCRPTILYKLRYYGCGIFFYLTSWYITANVYVALSLTVLVMALHTFSEYMQHRAMDMIILYRTVASPSLRDPVFSLLAPPSSPLNRLRNQVQQQLLETPHTASFVHTRPTINSSTTITGATTTTPSTRNHNNTTTTTATDNHLFPPHTLVTSMHKLATPFSYSDMNTTNRLGCITLGLHRGTPDPVDIVWTSMIRVWKRDYTQRDRSHTNILRTHSTRSHVYHILFRHMRPLLSPVTIVHMLTFLPLPDRLEDNDTVSAWPRVSLHSFTKPYQDRVSSMLLYGMVLHDRNIWNRHTPGTMTVQKGQVAEHQSFVYFRKRLGFNLHQASLWYKRRFFVLQRLEEEADEYLRRGCDPVISTILARSVFFSTVASPFSSDSPSSSSSSDMVSVLPPLLARDLEPGECYAWIKTLAPVRDSEYPGPVGVWSSVAPCIVECNGAVHWSTSSPLRSMRISYTFRSSFS